MRRLQVITGIVALLLLSGCAGTPRHAPVQGTVTRGHQLDSGVLRPGGRPVTGPRQVCGRSPSGDMGNATGRAAPCTEPLSVPVTVRPVRSGRPQVSYLRRPCLCGSN
jgi:hypothetical protein